MSKYVLYIAEDGICDIEDFEDVGFLFSGDIVIEGYENAVAKRNEINIKNGFGIVGD